MTNAMPNPTTSEHYFTAHTSARLTFVIGVVIGMSVMTLSGIGFFTYVFSGGEIQSYAIAPLDTDSQILTEPIKQITEQDQTVIAEPNASQVVGATENYTVTLVQYLDYECRFCKKFFPDVLALTTSHSDTVRLVIKHYPLVQIHPQAKAASLAAVCAAEQNKLVDYSTKLYERQDQLADMTVFETVASELALNLEEFNSCRTADATVAQVEADALEAQQLGVQTQPNLVIVWANGDQELIDGYVNADYLASALGF
ncbi:MAG: thioredoxin domain-containing protein [Candidatus Kerfeldbacteria bacterium]|nr:thioredoxin domain-containing protein [Candidatus Kerfeldbacteria bacterium]